MVEYKMVKMYEKAGIYYSIRAEIILTAINIFLR